MATLVVETGAGLSTANSYCTTREADEYYAAHLYGSSWENSEYQPEALMWATRLLDQCVNWKGYKKTEDQALRWPRTGVIDPDGHSVDEDSIPTFLKHATAELARYLIDSDRTAETDISGFKEIEVDVIKLKIDKHNKTSIIPKSVWAIIRPYGYRPSRVITTARI